MDPKLAPGVTSTGEMITGYRHPHPQGG